MNLKKTGEFIAELRKQEGLTQEQLGEKIGVTNKTVSRWETGVYLPPVDILEQLSNLFSVSINEILAGRRLDEKEYRKAAEENLKATIKEGAFDLKDRIEYYKKKWMKEHIALMVVMGIIVIAAFAAGLIFKHGLIVLSPVLLLVFHGIRNNRMMAYVEQNAFYSREG